MKMKFFKGLLLLCLSFTFMGCPQDDDNNMNSDDDGNAQNLEQLAEGGDWEVTNFFDTDSDETSDFNGYSFSFNDDGTLIATNGTITVEGSWSISDDSNSSDDDGSSDDLDFNIFFNVSQDSDFEDLNDDWDIILVNSSKIDLIDVSGGNGGTDLLTFER